MKETVNVNIGSTAFTLDVDAYRLLDRYFDDIRRRLPEDVSETMADIEARMAEIFREQVTSPMCVVTVEMARAAMTRMGDPSAFGEPRTAAPQTDPMPGNTPRKLYRSRTERSIAGVCGGLAKFFGVEASMMRLLTLLLIFFGGLSIWVYIILWIVIPEEPIGPYDLLHRKL